MNKKNYQIFDEEDSIDLIEILSTLWIEKKFIIITTIIFSIVGIVYSLSLKNSFTASSIFYPHYENNTVSESQGLRNLAGLAGIDIGGAATDNIPPSLYPKIIASPEFKIEILNSKIILGEDELTYREYLSRKTPQFQLNFKKILLFPISLYLNLFQKQFRIKD